MLGVMLNPTGDFSAQLRALKKKVDNFASRILSPRLNSKDIRTFHRSIYMSSMRYVLAALAVDEEELSSVQSRVLRSLLQQMGIQSTIPTSIRHGPLEMGGLDLYDLRTEVGIEAVKFFRNAIYSDSENGNMLRLNLQYSQLESGVGELLLENPNLHLPYLAPTWILSLRHFLFCHNMTITITDAYSIPRLKSSTDEYIMQSTHLSRYSISQQRDINLVRMYLQVDTLADMTDPSDPKAICTEYLDVTRPPSSPRDSRWPRQHAPTKPQQRLWKGYIKSSFLRYVPFWKTQPLPTRHSSPSEAPTEVHPTPHASLFEYIKSLPLSYRRLLLDGLEQVASDQEIGKAFRTKSRIFIASDGGLYKTWGTHGWIIFTGKQVLFKCAGPLDGPFDASVSTRCEIAGCASSLLLLVSLSRFWGLRHRSIFRWSNRPSVASIGSAGEASRLLQCHLTLISYHSFKQCYEIYVGSSHQCG